MKSPAKSEPAARPPSPDGRRLVGWRLWVLRLVLVAAAPLIFLSLAELALRVSGYGYPTDLFIRAENAAAYRANARFGWRFVPRAMSRAPLPYRFPAVKPPGTCRIFVLGGSAAQGVPVPEYGFSRILACLLREQYPGVRFEVINAAMTAINSHVVLEVARECAAYEPDFFIVYLGHNEVVGPYGPGTVLSEYRPGLTAIRAAIRVKSTRVGQLLTALTEALGTDRGQAAGQWEGMQMFASNHVASDDPRMPTVYDHFRANLSDICLAARRAPAKAIVCTVVTDLRDCPPFASLHRPHLSDADQGRWQQAYEAGLAAETAGEHEKALQQYRQAAAIDDAYAELHFRMARCALALGSPDAARAHFVRARDLDALRFRADTPINAIIREVAADREAEGVYLLDAERLFERHPGTPHGIPGGEWLHEHVHLTFEGNDLLARAVLDRMAPLLPPAVRDRRAAADPPDATRCGQMLARTAWDRLQEARLVAELMSGPPFTGQIGHAERLARLQQRVRDLDRFGSPEAMRVAADAYREAVQQTSDDDVLRTKFAGLEAARGEPASAIEQWQIVAQNFPDNVQVRNSLGVALVLSGKPREAIAHYQAAVRIQPWNPVFHRNLGDAFFLLDEPAHAADQYQEAIRLRPDQAETHRLLARALLKQQKPTEAAAQLTEALRLEPDARTHHDLAIILAVLGKTDEAVQHFRQALEMAKDPQLVRRIREKLQQLERRQRAAATGPAD